MIITIDSLGILKIDHRGHRPKPAQISLLCNTRHLGTFRATDSDVILRPGCEARVSPAGDMGNAGDTMGIPWDINGRYHPHGGINGILMGYYWDTLW